MEIDPKKIESLALENKEKLQEYQKLFMRLKVLNSQMEDIKEETNDLLETLDKMRVEDKNNNNNG